MNEKYYTRQEVANRLSVSLRTIERRIKDGLLIDIKIGPNGRTSRISESAVQDYLNSMIQQQNMLS